MLKKDKEEVEAIKHAKALEAEKAMYSVRLKPQKTRILCIFVCKFVHLHMCDCLRAVALADRGESSERRG